MQVPSRPPRRSAVASNPANKQTRPGASREYACAVATPLLHGSMAPSGMHSGRLCATWLQRFSHAADADQCTLVHDAGLGRRRTWIASARDQSLTPVACTRCITAASGSWIRAHPLLLAHRPGCPSCPSWPSWPSWPSLHGSLLAQRRHCFWSDVCPGCAPRTHGPRTSRPIAAARRQGGKYMSLHQESSCNDLVVPQLIALRGGLH
jgi:hypothetical protein